MVKTKRDQLKYNIAPYIAWLLELKYETNPSGRALFAWSIIQKGLYAEC